MNPENEKANKFLATAEDLLKTDMTIRDIYTSIMTRNKSFVACEYINAKGKLKHYKYKKQAENVKMYAAGIQRKLKDSKKDDIVVLKHANSPAWPELFWAIVMAGFRVLLVDARNSKEGTENLMKQSKAVAIVTDDMFLYENVKKIVPEDLVEYKGEPVEEKWANEVIFCSSGTTGDVKLMIFNGENLCHQINSAVGVGTYNIDIMHPKSMGQIRTLAMIPFHHIFGFVAVFLWYSFYSTTLVYPASLAPSDLQAICQKAKVTHLFSVPLFWDSLALQINRKFALQDESKQELINKMIAYNLGEISKEEAGLAASKIARKKVQSQILGDHIRFAISGGGFISQETLRTINGLGYVLANGYGMTEVGVGSVELSNDPQERLLGRIGHPFNGVEYKIVDNQLFVKSKTIHVREIIGGVETKTKLDKEGYFATGDIAEVDENGSYTLKGRIKDVIINANGENIFPDELEIFFKELPHINNLCVLGIAKQDKQHEENVTLVLETDNSITEEEIKNLDKLIKEIEVKLPHQTKIDEVYLSKGKLPLANSMKVKRYVIKKSIENGNDEYIPLNQKHQVKKEVNFDKKTVDEILIPVREIFSKVLLLPTYKIEDDAHWINDLGGDSMSYVELIKDLQDHFQISFKEETLGVMATVNDFVSEIASLKKNNK